VVPSRSAVFLCTGYGNRRLLDAAMCLQFSRTLEPIS
jgi:hypothetical protein